MDDKSYEDMLNDIKIIRNSIRSKARRVMRQSLNPPKIEECWTELWRNLFAKACVMQDDNYNVDNNNKHAVKGHYSYCKAFKETMEKGFSITALDKYTFRINTKTKWSLRRKWIKRNNKWHKEVWETPIHQEDFITAVYNNFHFLLTKQYHRDVYFHSKTGLIHLIPRPQNRYKKEE